jgi:5-oxoprolinase (ATP-hydrolysing)
MNGGGPGTCGRNLLIRKNGVIVNIGGRCSTLWKVDERLRIETPGAGAYGSESE